MYRIDLHLADTLTPKNTIHSTLYIYIFYTRSSHHPTHTYSSRGQMLLCVSKCVVCVCVYSAVFWQLSVSLFLKKKKKIHWYECGSDGADVGARWIICTVCV